MFSGWESGEKKTIAHCYRKADEHIASAKYTIDIMAEAPTIVFVVNSLGKKYYGRINNRRTCL